MCILSIEARCHLLAPPDAENFGKILLGTNRREKREYERGVQMEKKRLPRREGAATLGVLQKLERIGDKIPDATILFLWFIAITLIASFILSKTSMPSILGILMSQNTTSGFSVFTATSPSIPFSATDTSCPSKERMSFMELRMLFSSSITSIFAMVVFLVWQK